MPVDRQASRPRSGPAQPPNESLTEPARGHHLDTATAESAPPPVLDKIVTLAADTGVACEAGPLARR